MKKFSWSENVNGLFLCLKLRIEVCVIFSKFYAGFVKHVCGGNVIKTRNVALRIISEIKLEHFWLQTGFFISHNFSLNIFKGSASWSWNKICMTNKYY